MKTLIESILGSMGMGDRALLKDEWIILMCKVLIRLLKPWITSIRFEPTKTEVNWNITLSPSVKPKNIKYLFDQIRKDKDLKVIFDKGLADDMLDDNDVNKSVISYSVFKNSGEYYWFMYHQSGVYGSATGYRSPHFNIKKQYYEDHKQELDEIFNIK